MEKDFKFFIPAEIIEKAGKNGEKKMVVDGVASTNKLDRQGEVLEPNGYDTSYFLSHGIINWHHQANQSPDSIIGYPTVCKVIDNGNSFYVKGELFPKSKMAQKVYQLIKDLKGTPRQIGWSIEGKATERDPLNKNRVLKARLTGIALTHAPIGVGTFADIAKGFSEDTVFELSESAKNNDANGGKQNVLTMELANGKTLQVSEDGAVSIKKTMTTESASALKRESVEGKLKKPKQVSDDDIYDTIFKTFPQVSINRAKEMHKAIKKKMS